MITLHNCFVLTILFFSYTVTITAASSATTTTRIVGGTPVDSKTKYPYFIEWEDAKCGASLVHDDIALSAGHCENELHPFDTRLFLMGLTSESGIPRFVERQVAHPLYNGDKSQDYDFLILKLSESALVDDNGKPTGVELVQLNKNPKIPKVGDALTGMGFGKLNADAQETSENFNEVEVYYVDDDTCKEQYGSDFLKELMFCAAVPGGGRDTCQGDSGGPIIHQSTGKQVGIVSYGIGCALPDYAGVNSRVSAVYEWIEQQICELSDFPPARCFNGSSSSGTAGPPANIAPDTLPPGGAGQLSVHVQFDQYPKETAWSLTYLSMPEDQEPYRLFLHPFSQETIGKGDYQKQSFTNLPAGTYSLQVGDQADDGICCTFGEGEIWVTNDKTGAEIWSNRTFKGYTEAILEINAAGAIVVSEVKDEYDNSWEAFEAVNHPPSFDSQWPGGLPSANTFSVMVNVKYDDYPQEITWEFTNVNPSGNAWRNNPIQRFNGATQGVSGSLISVEINNLSEGWHRYKIVDSRGDGICCGFRRGWTSLTGGISTTRQKGLIFGNNGEFGRGTEVFLYISAEGFVSQVSYSDPLEGNNGPAAYAAAPVQGTSQARGGSLRKSSPGERRDLEREDLPNLDLISFTDLPNKDVKRPPTTR